MLRLTPLRFDKVWGYELWTASTHRDGQQEDFTKAVSDYPLLVKIIQADETLSVQVHPDDEKARLLEGNSACGKTECWYVLDAKPGARLVYGLKKQYSKSEIQKAIQDNSLENCLNQTEVHKGDFIFIPAGTVHAIGGGLRLLEIQQSCNITYRLYDWGRPRELHIEKGISSIKELELESVKPLESRFSCRYFSINRIELSDSCTVTEGDSPTVELIFISKGEGTLISESSDGNRTETAFSPEQTFAVLPGEKVTAEGSAEIIRITPA